MGENGAIAPNSLRNISRLPRARTLCCQRHGHNCSCWRCERSYQKGTLKLPHFLFRHLVLLIKYIDLFSHSYISKHLPFCAAYNNADNLGECGFMSSRVRKTRQTPQGKKIRSSLELHVSEDRLSQLLVVSLKDMPLEERRKEAQKPLYLVRYE